MTDQAWAHNCSTAFGIKMTNPIPFSSSSLLSAEYLEFLFVVWACKRWDWWEGREWPENKWNSLQVSLSFPPLAIVVLCSLIALVAHFARNDLGDLSMVMRKVTDEETYPGGGDRLANSESRPTTSNPSHMQSETRSRTSGIDSKITSTIHSESSPALSDVGMGNGRQKQLDVWHKTFLWLNRICKRKIHRTARLQDALSWREPQNVVYMAIAEGFCNDNAVGGGSA